MSNTLHHKSINIFKIAAISLAIAVVLGALGAHALKAVLSESKLMSYETGVRYHIYHSIALLILGVIMNQGFTFSKWVLTLMIAGTVLFSGSIYLLATIPVHGLEFLKFLGPITPLGGLLLISSWVLFAFTIRKES